MNPEHGPIGVSIVIPAHNAASTLAETLQSVLNQTHDRWEAIVVDDGSTDRTAEIAKQFANKDRRIRMVQQPQAGEAGARNAGVSMARYDWLLFLDADDWISTLHLERMTQHLVMNSDFDAVICRSVRVAADGSQIPETFFPSPGDLFPVLARRAAFNVHTCIVRKSVVEEVGRFDPSLERLPDWDLWQKIARTGAQFGTIDDVLAFYRMRPDSVSLDAHLLFRDGLTILRRGHDSDPRVPKPLPKYAAGLPTAKRFAEEIYFLSWCAGIIIGQQNDATSLLESLNTHSEKFEVYPDAIAECIFHAVLLPICESPQIWEKLAPEILPKADHFFHALERRLDVEGLAHRSGLELRKLILRNSSLWNRVWEEQESKQETLEQLRQQAEKSATEWERIANEREHWRIHWEGVSEQKEIEQKKWQQLAEESDRWRNHWQSIADEKEKERQNWEHIAEERKNWLDHCQAAAEETQKDRDQWHKIADEREKWRAHWETIADQKGNDRDRWEQIATEQEKWRIHWQNLAENLEKHRAEWQRQIDDQNSKLADAQKRVSELNSIERSYQHLRKSFWTRLGIRLGFLKTPDS